MSARSSAPSALVLLSLLHVGACGKSAAPPPEADPAQVQQLAKLMTSNAPSPASVPTCTGAEIATGLQLTQRSLLQLAKEPLSDTPERADWINPPELDDAAVRTLTDPTADETARRRAAAVFVKAPAFTVYRVDMVNVPIALMVKELKRGALGMRAIRFAKGIPTCATVFTVQNDHDKSEWAMDKSDRATIDPKVAQVLRDDLKVQLLARVAALKTGT